MTDLLYGRNAVREALRAKRRPIYRLLLAKDLKITAMVQEIMQLARQGHVPIQIGPKNKFTPLGFGHQGVALEVGQYPEGDLFGLLDQVGVINDHEIGEATFLLALDHLEDPQNVGALLRTAEAVGVHGVIRPQRRSVGLTATVVNASAGAAEHLSIVTVSNLVQALRLLKQENIWIVGVENYAQAQDYDQVDLTMPLVLVLGNEGKGLSHLVRKTCDLLVRIPMRGRVESLNVSVAGALTLYEVWRARKKQTINSNHVQSLHHLHPD